MNIFRKGLSQKLIIPLTDSQLKALVKILQIKIDGTVLTYSSMIYFIDL